MPTKLLSAVSGSGASASFPTDGRSITLITQQTAGQVTVDVSPDAGTTWVPSSVGTTASGSRNFVGANGLLVRLSYTGATALNAWVAFGK